jgi:hypothetical protein
MRKDEEGFESRGRIDEVIYKEAESVWGCLLQMRAIHETVAGIMS